jgi:hypothetical protein
MKVCTLYKILCIFKFLNNFFKSFFNSAPMTGRHLTMLSIHKITDIAQLSVEREGDQGVGTKKINSKHFLFLPYAFTF